jgi:hypothetical protein
MVQLRCYKLRVDEIFFAIECDDCSFMNSKIAVLLLSLYIDYLRNSIPRQLLIVTISNNV